MARVKRGMTTHARHKKVLAHSKGFRGRSSTCYRAALGRLEKALQYAYRDRRTKKRNMRALWIQRINAAVRELGMKYSTFINALAKRNIEIDRKTMAKFAVENPDLFGELVSMAKSQCAGSSVCLETVAVTENAFSKSVDADAEIQNAALKSAAEKAGNLAPGN